MRRGFRHDWRNRLDDRRGLDRACRPLSPRRGLRQWGGEDLFDRPQRDVIEADQRARRLDLGVDHGVAAASIVEDAEAPGLCPPAGLGEGTAGYYLQHGKILPMSRKRWKRSRDGSALR